MNHFYNGLFMDNKNKNSITIKCDYFYLLQSMSVIGYVPTHCYYIGQSVYDY